MTVESRASPPVRNKNDTKQFVCLKRLQRSQLKFNFRAFNFSPSTELFCAFATLKKRKRNKTVTGGIIITETERTEEN